MRASGILMPVFSLPGPYGIGTLGNEAFAFVDFLAAAKQTYWQILPIGPTGYGDSPYQSFSAFAGNPYFIDFRLLAADGLLTEAELPAPSRWVPSITVRSTSSGPWCSIKRPTGCWLPLPRPMRLSVRPRAAGSKIMPSSCR